MGRILIQHGTVVTVDARRRIIRDGAVAIDGDKIVGVGKSAEFASFNPERTFDATGKLVMPGIVDAHCHNLQTLCRGLGDDVDLIGWCYDRIYPYEVLLDEESAFVNALLTQAEMIRTGTTAFADPGAYVMDSVAKAIAQSGMRGCITWAGMDQWSEDRPLVEGLKGKLSTEETLRVEEELVKKHHDTVGGRVHASYGLRVEPNVSEALYKGIKRLADRDGLWIHYHAAVDPFQVGWVMRHTGSTVIEYMNRIGVLDSNWLLVHMTTLTDHEVELLAQHDTRVCHNPGASIHGAYGAATNGKFPEMLEQGVTVAMGCDSCAANNSLDMFRTMYEVATIHKERRMDPDLISPEQALEMATINGARAIQWDGIGSLTVGNKADVIIVDMQRSNWVPIHDFSLIPTLVYSGEGADVETSIIDGKVVMENRKILTIDVPSLLKQAQEITERIIPRLPYKLKPAWPFE